MTVVPQSNKECDEQFEIALNRSIDVFMSFSICLDMLETAIEKAGFGPDSELSSVCCLLHDSVGHGIATVTGLLEGISEGNYIFSTGGTE